jgi:hypothetical protein
MEAFKQYGNHFLGDMDLTAKVHINKICEPVAFATGLLFNQFSILEVILNITSRKVSTQATAEIRPLKTELGTG